MEECMSMSPFGTKTKQLKYTQVQRGQGSPLCIYIIRTTSLTCSKHKLFSYNQVLQLFKNAFVP